MPHLANVKNGAGSDLNPGFAKAFGLKQPFMIEGSCLGLDGLAEHVLDKDIYGNSI
jgi:hypothetical protein